MQQQQPLIITKNCYLWRMFFFFFEVSIVTLRGNFANKYSMLKEKASQVLSYAGKTWPFQRNDLDKKPTTLWSECQGCWQSKVFMPCTVSDPEVVQSSSPPISNL